MGRARSRQSTCSKPACRWPSYAIRSECQFCERPQYDLLFKWFLDLNVEDEALTTPASPRTGSGCSCTTSRGPSSRLCSARRIACACSPASTSGWTGPPLESWASFKSLKPRPNLGGQRKPKKRSRGRRGGGGRNPGVDFQGNGREARLSLAGHVLIDGRTAGQPGYRVSQRIRKRVERSSAG